jgi:mRNA-degrading endonuclease RelE of RelBE toxin-antitoxin system
VAEVRLARRAVKDLDTLPKRTATRVLEALEKLGEDPRSDAVDVKALEGRRPWRRMRVGNHRVVFRAAERGAVLLVARVVDRKELEQALRNLG